MKRSALVLLFALIFSQTSLAQIEFGPRLGVSAAKLTFKNNVQSFVEGNPVLGFQAGVFLRAPIKVVDFYIQPEVLYTNSGAVISDVSGDSEYDFDRVDVPVLMGKDLGLFRISAGPVFRFQLESKITRPDGTISFIRNSFEDTTVGYQVGAGIDVMKFVLDLKFEGSLTDVSERGGANAFGTDIRINQWILAVGYKLFK